jgi:hypothetical protein
MRSLPSAAALRSLPPLQFLQQFAFPRLEPLDLLLQLFVLDPRYVGIGAGFGSGLVAQFPLLLLDLAESLLEVGVFGEEGTGEDLVLARPFLLLAEEDLL